MAPVVTGAEVRAEWSRRFGRPGPGAIICVGLNYHDHAAEQGVEAPSQPLLFSKLPNTLSGPGEAIALPPESNHVDGEAELAIVIGTKARRVGRSDAVGVVAGYVCANDVSARDIQFEDGQWLRGKSFDGFCPLGTSLVGTGELGDASGLRIVQRLNGVILQDSSTDDLIFGVAELVAYASNVTTLEPGDLILTGTPAGVGIFRDPPVPLRPGDVVEIEIEGIGTLVNPVVAEPAG